MVKERNSMLLAIVMSVVAVVAKVMMQPYASRPTTLTPAFIARPLARL
jgi:hypothetical protein